MGHQHHGFAKPPDKLPHLLLQPEPQMVVQSGEGLVQQQNVGIGNQNPCQRRALLLPAGKLGGQVMCKGRQAEAVHNGSYHRFPFLPVRLPVGPGPDILQHRHVGKQGIILEQ